MYCLSNKVIELKSSKYIGSVSINKRRVFFIYVYGLVWVVQT